MGIKLPVAHLEMNLAHIPFARAAYTIQGVSEVEIENVMFNSKNRPYCIKCGNEIRKLVHAYTVHEKRGNLYVMRCGCCGATMLGRDNGYYDKNRKK